jgi:cation transport regulator
VPYESISELPKSVRNLPRLAKILYLKAFNSAWEEYAGEGEDSREKAAHSAAWAAVREEYEKDEETGEWVRIGDIKSSRRSHHALRHRQRTRPQGGAAA